MDAPTPTFTFFNLKYSTVSKARYFYMSSIQLIRDTSVTKYPHYFTRHHPPLHRTRCFNACPRERMVNFRIKKILNKVTHDHLVRLGHIPRDKDVSAMLAPEATTVRSYAHPTATIQLKSVIIKSEPLATAPESGVGYA